MDKFGSVAATASAGAGGGVHSGIAAAMFGLVGRNEDLDVDERNRLLKEREKVTGVVRDAGKMRLRESNTINLSIAWRNDSTDCNVSWRDKKKGAWSCVFEK